MDCFACARNDLISWATDPNSQAGRRFNPQWPDLIFGAVGMMPGVLREVVSRRLIPPMPRSLRGLLRYARPLGPGAFRRTPDMRKSDVTCPECNAGYRRIELTSRPGTQVEFRCLWCDHEVSDGSTEIALRLTVQPKQYSGEG